MDDVTCLFVALRAALLKKPVGERHQDGGARRGLNPALKNGEHCEMLGRGNGAWGRRQGGGLSWKVGVRGRGVETSAGKREVGKLAWREENFTGTQPWQVPPRPTEHRLGT